MALLDEELRVIVARSSSLSERLAGEFECSGVQDPEGHQRRKRLIDHAPGCLAYSERLPDQGEKDVLPVLGNVVLPEGSAIPKWAGTLVQLSAFIERPPSGEPAPPSERAGFPFQDLYRAMVAFGRFQVEALAEAALRRMHRSAWKGLELQLTSRLSSVCSLALQSEFLAYKAIHGSRQWTGLFHIREHRVTARDNHYRRFISKQKEDGLATFFSQYPTAGRLCAQLVQDWICWVVEFLKRLTRDWSDIGRLFDRHERSTQVVNVHAGISDPHNGGRSVLILTFEGGRRIVYKPRCLAVDKAFFDLLGWLNLRKGANRQRTLIILDRRTYGWMEFASSQQCRTTDEVRNFYQRVGSLLAIVHALRGVDFHRENILAAGEYPVLFDMEALCHPPTDTLPLGITAIEDTVLRTGLLPLYHQLPTSKRIFDMSGLASPVKLRRLTRSLAWKNLGTDEMEVAAVARFELHASHRPRIAGKIVSPRPFADIVAEGFLHTMAFIRKYRHNAEFDKLWTAIHNSPTRVIRRPSFVYSMLLRSLQNPKFLREGVDRSIELHALPFKNVRGSANLYLQEIASLERLDVPYFAAPPPSVASSAMTEGSNSSDVQQAQIIRLALKSRIRANGNQLVPRATSP